MVSDRNEKKQVVALLGAGSMGTAIVRRIDGGVIASIRTGEFKLWK